MLISYPTIDISKINKNEVDFLRSISVQTFTETFSKHNSDTDMQKYIHQNLSIQKLTKELNTKDFDFYFLKSDNTIIGYLKLNSELAQTEFHSDSSVEIERIYLTQQNHSRGFGTVLLKHAINTSKKQNASYIWLGVWEQNLRAISFYKKNEFKQFDTHVFKLGEDEQTDILMKLELN